MGAAGKRATRADQGVARRHAVWRGDTAAAGLPRAHGLYDPALEKDSCGVGFIADIKGKKSHTIVEQGLSVLRNLSHRGAVGWDPKLSDYATPPPKKG